jgi:hypothetical protein
MVHTFTTLVMANINGSAKWLAYNLDGKICWVTEGNVSNEDANQCSKCLELDRNYRANVILVKDMPTCSQSVIESGNAPADADSEATGAEVEVDIPSLASELLGEAASEEVV